MNAIKHIKIILSALAVVCFFGLKSQTCFDFNLPNPATFYNSFTEYPTGSVLHESGDIKMKNYREVISPINPTILDSTSVEPGVFGPKLYFQGRLVFDVTDYPSECKKVTLSASGGSFFIDTYQYFLSGGPVLPFTIGDSISVTAGSGDGMEIIGKFDSISIQTGTGNSFVENFCLEDCSNTEDCSADFEFEVVDNTVTFTNTSSINAIEADVLNWNFTGEELSQVDEITYTYSSIGKYEACVFFSLSSCVNGTSHQKCDSVEIVSLANDASLLGKGDHFVLSPNDDGVQDFIHLQAGSKIFDRNGQLVLAIDNEMQWAGTTANNEQLGTGLYTVAYNGYTFQITIVR